METLTAESRPDIFNAYGNSFIHVNGRRLVVRFISSGLGRSEYGVYEREVGEQELRVIHDEVKKELRGDPDHVEAVKRRQRMEHAEYMVWAVRKGFPPTESMNPIFERQPA